MEIIEELNKLHYGQKPKFDTIFKIEIMNLLASPTGNQIASKTDLETLWISDLSKSSNPTCN